MVNILILVAGVLSILGSLITAWLCYKIYSYNRLSKGWLSVVWAFIFVILRRSMGFARDFNVFPDLNNLFSSIESVLLILISVLYIIGFYSMLRNFENFEVVEKKVRVGIKKVKKESKNEK